VDDSCGDLLTDTDVDDDTGSDDSCDDGSSGDRGREDSSCDDQASIEDPCAETDDSADSSCDDQPRAASHGGDGCGDDEPRDPCGDTLAAVDNGSDSSEPTVDPGPGLADPGAIAPLIPVDIPVPERVATFEAIAGIGGDTAAVLGSVSGQLADAGRIAHAPLTGAGAAGIAGELGRADVSGRAAAALSPLVTGEEMRNDVIADEQRRQSLIAARETESDALLVLEEAEGALGDV
jgi:hypothetical protein